MTRKGWLKRQAEQIQKEAKEWPEWKKQAARSDDARRQDPDFQGYPPSYQSNKE